MMNGLETWTSAHTLVSMVALGMAAAFVFADRRSATSRALAATLVMLGVGIFLNVNLIRNLEHPPTWSGWLAVPEGLSIAFYLEWLLRIRRTLPSNNFQTNVGDRMLRLGQVASAVYVVESILWPVERVHDLYGAATVGFAIIQRPGFWLFATPVLFACVMGLGSTLLLMNRRPDRSERIRLLGFIFGAPFLIAGFVLPLGFSAISVMLGLMVVLIGSVQYHVLQGQRGQFLSRFLSPQVAEIVSSRGLQAAMQQAHVELSVVCCDLRGFSAYAQAHPSSRVIEVLRDYYAVVGQIVGEYGATIKDYAGDGILILVGAPLPIERHAMVALEMAERIRDAGRLLTKRWSSLRSRLGIGLGVASGFVTVGVIGSDSRLEYTAVGPAVNLASRLCEEARDREILVAPRTAELTGRDDLRKQKAGVIKGFDDLDEIYTLKAA